MTSSPLARERAGDTDPNKTGFSGIHSSWITDEQHRQYVGVGITGRADDRLRQLSLRCQVRE